LESLLIHMKYKNTVNYFEVSETFSHLSSYSRFKHLNTGVYIQMPAYEKNLYPPIMINRHLANIVNLPKKGFRQTRCRVLMQFPKQTPPVPYST